MRGEFLFSKKIGVRSSLDTSRIPCRPGGRAPLKGIMTGGVAFLTHSVSPSSLTVFI